MARRPRRLPHGLMNIFMDNGAGAAEQVVQRLTAMIVDVPRGDYPAPKPAVSGS